MALALEAVMGYGASEYEWHVFVSLWYSDVGYVRATSPAECRAVPSGTTVSAATLAAVARAGATHRHGATGERDRGGRSEVQVPGRRHAISNTYINVDSI